MADFQVSVVPTTQVDRLANMGMKMVVELTRHSGDEDTPYGTVGEMVADQMQSSVDYGLLFAAMLEYFDDDGSPQSKRLYDALDEALVEYVDNEWQRICAGDDRFVR